MQKIILPVCGCFLILAVVTKLDYFNQVDPVATYSSTPSFESVLTSSNNSGRWFINAKTMAGFDRTVGLKLPVSFEF
jgi:hypothetical protein